VSTAARRPPGALGKAVADILYREVTEQGLTQAALAEMVGLSQTQIGAYLGGTRFITLDEAWDICQALGLTFSEVAVEAEGYVSS
jgi:transcriptional regulator with XRE-family HTH domain